MTRVDCWNDPGALAFIFRFFPFPHYEIPSCTARSVSWVMSRSKSARDCEMAVLILVEHIRAMLFSVMVSDTTTLFQTAGMRSRNCGKVGFLVLLPLAWALMVVSEDGIRLRSIEGICGTFSASILALFGGGGGTSDPASGSALRLITGNMGNMGNMGAGDNGTGDDADDDGFSGSSGMSTVSVGLTGAGDDDDDDDDGGGGGGAWTVMLVCLLACRN